MYKDSEKQKAYQREWERRKRSGVPTRLTPHLTAEEREEILVRRKARKVVNNRRAGLKIRAKRRELIVDSFGDVCQICGGKWRSRLTMHKKDGQSHQKLQGVAFEVLKDAVRSGEFAYLCYRCHKSVHWCMEMLGMSWKEIELAVKK